MSEPEPVFAFDDSRRLTGANRYFGGPAVVLTAGGAAAYEAAAHCQWVHLVKALAQALGWADPMPVVHLPPPASKGEVMLAFAAPVDALFTATEVNEWAWEHGAAVPGAWPQDTPRAQPEDPWPLAHFQQRAAAEFSRPLARLRQAAAARGLPWLEDDNTVSIGAGSGSVSYPRSALPMALDVPWPQLHAVPTALITGSNGKTTTARLVAAMARAAGLTPGMCSTEGVWVGPQLLSEGDYAGPAGARAVLRHPAVQVAILETARGGILRRGLAVQRADVAVVTNISADHLGEYGIHDTTDIALAKLAVVHALQATAAMPTGGMRVLNADDGVLMQTAANTPHVARIPAAHQALFAVDHDHPALTALRLQGGSTCGLREGRLCLWHLGQAHDLGAEVDLPITLQGRARFNTANAMAAVLAATALGMPPAVIRATLQSFGSRPGDNPGRLECWRYQGATVLVDYAHNPDGLAQLLSTARALKPLRLGLLLGQAGNRDDHAIAELAHIAARFAPDSIVIKELPAMLRGRAAGEVSALLLCTLLHAQVARACLHQEADEWQAVLKLLAWAEPGDAVVLPVHTLVVRGRLVLHLDKAGQGHDESGNLPKPEPGA